MLFLWNFHELETQSRKAQPGLRRSRYVPKLILGEMMDLVATAMDSTQTLSHEVMYEYELEGQQSRIRTLMVQIGVDL